MIGQGFEEKNMLRKVERDKELKKNKIKRVGAVAFLL